MDMRHVADAVQRSKAGGQLVRRQAVVVSTQTGGLTTIRIGGSSTSISGVRKYSYVGSLLANDVVDVLVDGTDLVIIGKLATY